MRKSVRIYINQQDIDKGTQKDSFCCPIHNSIKRKNLLRGKCFGVCKDGILIGPNKKTILNGECYPSINLTPKAKTFIEAFDSNKSSVKPTHITLIDESGKYL